ATTQGAPRARVEARMAILSARGARAVMAALGLAASASPARADAPSSHDVVLPSAPADDPRAAIASRLRADPPAQAIALRLFDRDKIEVSVEAAHRMDGGYRGSIAIVPALPTFAERPHLAWTDAAFADFGAF